MRVCRLDDIVPDTGVCALVGEEQVAVFNINQQIYAVGNRDPFSGANVMSRGIVGDLKGELVVASPVYKQHFSLKSGKCLEDANVRLPVYAARVEEGFVVVDPRATVTARAADLHLAIKPGTDVALFNAMLHVLLRERLVDREYLVAHTEGFDLLDL